MAVKLMSNPTAFEATRDGFGRALAALGEKDSRIIGLSGDLNDSTRVDWLKEKRPKQFVQAGIAEQNMVGMACGLSLAGFVPFAATFGAFTFRAADHIRVSVAFSNLNVKIVATHCGVTTGEDGGNAQVLEDLAFFRSLPNFTVVSPCDSLEAYKATEVAAGLESPVYLRLGREKVPIITCDETPFSLGKAETFHDGSDVAIIATGIEVNEAMIAARELAKEKISARVINMHTIKPIDEEAIAKAAKECGCIVTAEEHQVTGGLGGAVAEVVAQRQPVPMRFVGVQNRFGESGKGSKLLKHFKLTSEFIAKAAKEAIKARK